MFNLDNNTKKFLQYNKVRTGIPGLDKLLYDGLVIPESNNESLLLVIRGGDNTEKTIFGLQLLTEIGRQLSCICDQSDKVQIQYYCNYLDKMYIEDLLLDMLIASGIRQLTRMHLEGETVDGHDFAKCFFDTDTVFCKSEKNPLYQNFPNDQYLKRHTDKMICEEALYYNNRTNALHLRIYDGDNTFVSNDNNAIFPRYRNTLNEYLVQKKKNPHRLRNAEIALCTKYIKTYIHEKTGLSILEVCSKIKEDTQTTKMLLGLNIVNSSLAPFSAKDFEKLIELIRQYKVCILSIRDDVPFPLEMADMVIDLRATDCFQTDYQLTYLNISKSRYQTTALGKHQYKRRDYGIEVYPSLHLYCQTRRYLQRAIVYTHSNVIRETYQQYLDKKGHEGSYDDYIASIDQTIEGHFHALSPSASKNFNIFQVLDRIFINPVNKSIPQQKGKRLEQDVIENDFLYGYNGGITAVMGDGNTFKRYLTFGSAFSSSYRQEHTLFLLLNKDDKIARRRLQCPARKNKLCTGKCKECYDYMHFMNIMLGNITPEEFLYFLLQQIETKYPENKTIKRIIIDDLQVVEYCFPFLLREPLFLPALVDECRDKGIALYILCDKHSRLSGALRSLSDNVVCTERDKKGDLHIYIEHYAGYNSTPSKIFHGSIKKYENLFKCYEMGSDNNRSTHFAFNSVVIDEHRIFSMDKFWNNND